MRFTMSVKSSEALPSQVVQVVTKVIEEQRAGKGHIFVRPDRKGRIGSPKGTVPFVRGLVRTLLGMS